MAQGVFKQFDYYYGKEADSFHFIQVPRFCLPIRIFAP